MRLIPILIFLFACSQAPVKAPPKIRKPSPYPRVETGIKRVCSVSQEQDGYEERYIFDCREDYSPSTRIFAGYGFRSRPGHPYTTGMKSPYRRGKVARSIDMISRNHALNETYLYVIDFAGGPDSHDLKSVIYLFPRTDLPAISEAASEVELLLPTGEKVVFDAQTGAIKAGALREGPVDLTPDYRKRREPNVHYQGDYVSLRLSHAYEEPTIASAQAIVRQGENVCEIPRGKLFTAKGKLIPQNDDEVLELLNRSCPRPFHY